MSQIIPKAVAVFETTLYQSLSENETEMYLNSAMTKDGTELDAGVYYGFVIDSGNSNEEFVIGKPSSSDRKRIIDLRRGISYKDGVTSISSLKKYHLRGASVKITDAPILPAIVDSIVDAVNDVNDVYNQFFLRVRSFDYLNLNDNYTITQNDFGKILRNTSDNNITITIPTDSNLGITDSNIPYKFFVIKAGNGNVTIQGGTGVVLESIYFENPPIVITTKNNLVFLLKNGQNKWLVY